MGPKTSKIDQAISLASHITSKSQWEIMTFNRNIH